MIKRIVIDVDGCLSEFNESFVRLLEECGATMQPFETIAGPRTWHWPQVYGATYEQEERAWAHTRQVPEWWASHNRHRDIDEKALQGLIEIIFTPGVEVYFVSNRPRGARRWTALWLLEQLDLSTGACTVITTPADKGGILASLEPDVIIEDKAETLDKHDLAPTKVKCASILVRRPWNALHMRQHVVATTGQAFELAIEALAKAEGRE